MATPVYLTARFFLWRWSARYPRAGQGPYRYSLAVLAALTLIILPACSTAPAIPDLLTDLPPLHLGDDSVAVAEVAATVISPDLLALDDQMRDFVERYTSDVRNDRQRLMMLHRAVSGPATLGLRYDAAETGTAQQVFHRGTANCLSYANLFIALAREAGLDAGYQRVQVRPRWTRQGERVAITLHVNVEVTLGRRQRYMVDIDPLPAADISGTRTLDDADALALYHSNIGMQALAVDDTRQAWLQSVRALQLSPQMAHLWVNLGAVYRSAGQYAVAERSYLQALQLNPWERSAMNNLVVLYALQDRQVEHDYWEQRVAGYRQANPYYHAGLGEEAAQAGNWQEARRNYEKALELLPGDSSLFYALALTHEELGEPAVAGNYLQLAIDSATLRSQIETYQAHLERLQNAARPGT